MKYVLLALMIICSTNVFATTEKEFNQMIIDQNEAWRQHYAEEKQQDLERRVQQLEDGQ